MLALAAAATGATAGPINMITNGSFENNGAAAGTWDIRNSISGWTVGDKGVEQRNNVAGTAQAGTNFVELDTTGNSWISQSVATGYGDKYLLSFFYAPREGTNHNTNGIDVLWNGALLTSMSKDAGNGSPWIKYDFLVTAFAPVTALQFRASGNSDSFGGSLDNVSLVRAVPEPASFGIFALGGLALLATTRRRKSNGGATSTRP